MIRSIFNYKTNSIVERKVEWSTYLNRASNRLLFSNFLRNDQMIMCPVYYKNGTYDVQIGCTGKKKQNESFRMGMLRELDEELMIAPRSSTDLVLFDKMRVGNRIMTYIFTLDINKSMSSNESSNYQLLENRRGREDSNSRVCCFIVGDVPDMMSFFSKFNIQSLGEKYIFDNIIGFSMISVEQARQHALSTQQ
jgi:hypothetical protein